MSAVLFLGPSLPADEARAILPVAHVRPPAVAGDVLRAVQHGATVIGIVDGLFERVLSVWHKEILFALSRGVRVLGAASMGALRAAELHAFGMEGVGEVFEAYRDGVYEDDDEVAVAHAAAADGYRQQSEAMVNLRAGLRRCRERGLLDGGEHDALVAAVKALFYPDRSWSAVREAALARGMPRERADAIVADVRAEPPDVKRSDAGRLVHRVAELSRSGAPPPSARASTFHFEPTVFWERFARELRDEPLRPDGAPVEDGEPVDDATVARHALTTQGPSLRRAAFEAWLVDREAERAGFSFTPSAWRDAVTHFRRKRGLLRAGDVERWMRRNGVGEDDLARLVRRDAASAELNRTNDAEIRERLLDVLRERGELGATRDAARRRPRSTNRLAEHLSDEQVIAWFVRRAAATLEPGVPLWEQLGLPDAESLVRELRILYALERA